MFWLYVLIVCEYRNYPNLVRTKKVLMAKHEDD